MLVSILIPCYNVEKYLDQCLDSVINQTYKDLQIVIVDDGSTDKTLEIAQSYANKDSRIELYHQENKGVSAARNELLRHIKGEYFLFVDSDDWMELDMVEVLINNISDTDSDISVCDSTNVQTIKTGEFLRDVWSQDKVIEEFLKHIRISGALWNKLFRAEILRDVKFTNGISYGEDAFFCWQLFQNINTVTITNKQLYHHRIFRESFSNQSWSPDIKGSGHIVWEAIVSECKEKWPQYLSFAETRFALEDMWGIYFAAQSNYPYDEHIKLRQSNIKQNLHLILRADFASFQMKLFALVSCHNYKFCKLILAR